MKKYTKIFHGVNVKNMNEYIEIGIKNSYLVMTGKLTVEELIENRANSVIFFTSPENYTPKDIDEMIEYFESTEEYEKCMELVYVKNDMIAEYLTNKLIKNTL